MNKVETVFNKILLCLPCLNVFSNLPIQGSNFVCDFQDSIFFPPIVVDIGSEKNQTFNNELN